MRREVLGYLAGQPLPADRIGFPVWEAEPLASGDGNYIQSFERGIVTVKGDVIRVWVEPF